MDTKEEVDLQADKEAELSDALHTVTKPLHTIQKTARLLDCAIPKPISVISKGAVVASEIVSTEHDDPVEQTVAGVASASAKILTSALIVGKFIPPVRTLMNGVGFVRQTLIAGSAGVALQEAVEKVTEPVGHIVKKVHIHCLRQVRSACGYSMRIF